MGGKAESQALTDQGPTDTQGPGHTQSGADDAALSLSSAVPSPDHVVSSGNEGETSAGPKVPMPSPPAHLDALVKRAVREKPLIPTDQWKGAKNKPAAAAVPMKRPAGDMEAATVTKPRRPSGRILNLSRYPTQWKSYLFSCVMEAMIACHGQVEVDVILHALLNSLLEMSQSCCVACMTI